MKIEIKSILINCGLDIKNEQVINKIIWCLKGRFEKFGKVGLSRKEFEKFGITEKQLYLVIESLRDLGLITCIGYERIKTSKYKACVYQISSVLKGIFNLLSGFFIENLNQKIIEFNKKAKLEEVFSNFGIKFIHSNKRIGVKNSKITYSIKKNVISNWKEKKSYNLFNYLKESSGLNIKDLLFNLNIG